MAEIIKRGNPKKIFKGKAECCNCGCIFHWHRKDETLRGCSIEYYYSTVYCPECKENVIVSRDDGEPCSEVLERY